MMNIQIIAVDVNICVANSLYIKIMLKIIVINAKYRNIV